MSDIEATVQQCYRDLLGLPRRDEPLDLGRRLIEDDALSSLQLITFVTTVCEDCGVPLTALTEQDIARMKTLADIISILHTALHKENHA